MHRVQIIWDDGRRTAFVQVQDVNHWPSGLVELTFMDGSTKLISAFKEVTVEDMKEPKEGSSQVLTETNIPIVNRGDM